MTEMEKEFWHRRVEYNPEKEKMSGWGFLLSLFLLALCFYVGFTASGFFVEQPDYTYITKDALKQGDDTISLFDQKNEVILLVGADSRTSSDVGRSDTIILAFLDKKNKKVNLLSVLRDTYVTIPSSGERTKINHSYAYGGVPLLESTLEKNLGIEVDHYVQVDFAGFANLVDAVGGVTINVEKRMSTPEEGIDLQAGEQTLDGEDALGYVRFRKDGLGDVGRVERQQKFMKALMDEVLQGSSIFKIPTFISIFNKNVKTDLTTSEIFGLANTYRSMQADGLATYSLPGTADYINGVSYWIVDKEQTNALLQTLLSNEAEQTKETGGAAGTSR